MSLANIPTYSGGCQCGAVRFHIEGALGEPSMCHCRMCQKATGNFHAPLVGVRNARLSWTRGEPKRFASSNLVRRGFCPDCGTPLTYEAPTGTAIMIGAFDDPEDIRPVVQLGMEGKLPYFNELHGLPELRTEDDEEANEWLTGMVSHQHPDHDTDQWPTER